MQSLFKVLIEGKITFMPTYKFDRGTQNYDQKKMPCYADRILFVNNPQRLQLLEYNSCPKVNFTSHRPVFALFEVRTGVSNVDTQEMQKNYYDSLRHATLTVPLTNRELYPSLVDKEVIEKEPESEHFTWLEKNKVY